MSESRSQVENVKLAGVVNEVEVTITGQRQVHGQAGPTLDFGPLIIFTSTSHRHIIVKHYIHSYYHIDRIVATMSAGYTEEERQAAVSLQRGPSGSCDRCGLT
jgi:hypothetical protein